MLTRELTFDHRGQTKIGQTAGHKSFFYTKITILKRESIVVPEVGFLKHQFIYFSKR